MFFSQFISFVFLLAYVVIALLFLFYLSNSPKKLSIHALLSITGTFVLGVGILLFRVLRGLCTREVKYYHMFIQLCSFILFIVGVYLISGVTPNEHKNLAIIVLVAIVLQFAIAAVMFTFVFERQSFRLYYAPFHDIFGIWIYICLFAMLFTVIKEHEVEYPLEESRRTLTKAFLLTLSTLPLFIVLCPYFEWELTGPI